MKKLLSLSLALALVLTLCPLSLALADEPVTLRLWGGVQPEYGYDQVVANFNEEFKDKGVQLEYVRYVNNADGNLQLDTYLMSGGEIDVFMGYGGMSRLTARQDAGLVLDMTDGLTARGFDPEKELGAANTRGFLIGGRYYAVPTKYENSMYMFVNKDMFDAAGVEIPYNGWTYEQFRETARKLTQGEGMDKIYGMYWSYNNNSDIVRGILGTVLNGSENRTIYKNDECTESNFDDPVFEKSLQLLIDTTLTDGSAPILADEKGDNMSIPTMYLSGKAAMTMCISQIRLIKDLETYPHDFVTALVPFPVPDESYLAEFADHSNIGGAGDLICISSKTSHVEEALDFVTWYIKGGMAPLAQGGRVPLWNGVDQASVVSALMDGAEGVFDTDSILKYLSIDKTKLVPTGDKANYALNEIYTIMYEEIEAAMYGQKDAATAAKDMKARADKAIQTAMETK